MQFKLNQDNDTNDSNDILLQKNKQKEIEQDEEWPLSLKIKSILCLIGGFMYNLGFSSLFIWPDILLYLCSYIRCVDPSLDLKIAQVNIVWPLIWTTMNIIIPFNKELSDKIGRNRVLMIGSVIIPICALTCSYVKSIVLFSLIFGLGIGIVLGISLPIPYLAIYEQNHILNNYLRINFLTNSYFPHRKGLTFGILAIGIGIGTLPFNFIMQKVTNPSNSNPDVKADDDQYYYNCTIANHFPNGMRALAASFAIFCITGFLLMQGRLKEKEKQILIKLKQETDLKIQQQNQKDKQKKVVKPKKFCPNFRTSLSDPVTYQIMGITFGLTIMAGIFIPNQLLYGDTVINDSEFLSLNTGIGSLFNGLSRPIWGQIYDKVQFKQAIRFNYLLQTLVCLSFPVISKYKACYLIWTILTFIGYTGYAVALPFISIGQYGPQLGQKMYGVFFTGYTLSTWAGYIIIRFFANSNGDWDRIFIGSGIIIFIFGVFTLFTDFVTKDYNEEIIEKEININSLTKDFEEPKRSQIVSDNSIQNSILKIKNKL